MSEDQPGVLRLPAKLWLAMRQHVQSTAPQEACGVIAGKENAGLQVFPVENVLNSRTRYRMDPQQQLEVFLQIEDLGLELTAIYHSHPNGPPVPSPTDIVEAYYPQAIHLIWSPGAEGWQCRGFRIAKQTVSEIRLVIEPGE